jgi:hypothetical protein
MAPHQIFYLKAVPVVQNPWVEDSKEATGFPSARHKWRRASTRTHPAWSPRTDGLLPRRSNLVGYVRWDAQSDRFPPCQTIFQQLYRSQSGWPTIREVLRDLSFTDQRRTSVNIQFDPNSMVVPDQRKTERDTTWIFYLHDRLEDWP